MEVTAEPPHGNEVRLSAWKEARRDYGAAQHRMWRTALVLGPLSFVGLALLAGAQCPLPTDFLSVGGGSAAILLLWTYLGERCQAERERAGEELRAAEAALSQRPLTLESGSADRMVRVILTVLFVILWGWNWTVRPDCAADPAEDAELTSYQAESR